MFGMGFQELIVVGVVAVLLFGKRLPEVARTLGTSYRDFRRSLFEIQSQIDFTDSINSATTYQSSSTRDYSADDEDDDDALPTAPKLELPANATDERDSES